MPRAARKRSETGIYHVMLRGADRRLIFTDDEDCERFLGIMRKVKEHDPFELYAYCLMGNHVHLLLKEREVPLEILFKRIGVAYVSYYNRKYDLHGHLFQDRFRSEAVESDSYFMDVLRYICRNPIKAGLSERIEEYRWVGCTGIAESWGLTDSFEPYSLLHGTELREFINTPGSMEHIDYRNEKRLSDGEAAERLKKASGCERVQEIAGWQPEALKKLICTAGKEGVSLRQLSRLTGISRMLLLRLKDEI